MKALCTGALILLTAPAATHATTWLVGPTRNYTAPSKVSTLVHNGDTVEIDVGTYESDVARWTASDLVLRGTGGMAHLKANGANYGGKAIWVISGNNTTVESIEFSLCVCVDNNGAGIRQEGNDLTVRHCSFHDNQNGILGGGNSASNLLIEHCEFYNNGYGDGYTHNLYIGNINSLTFRFNYSHHAVVGHELKSRAAHNYILYNRIANESTGTASREIDLPNGGTAVIVGNEIEQGPRSENSGIIGYGLEGLSNPAAHRLILVNNTIVNDRGAGTFVSAQSGTELYKAHNNIFAGKGTPLSGAAAIVDTAGNLFTTVSNAGFVDAAAFDYRLAPASPAIDSGTDPGFDSTFALAPAFEYLHPADGVIRIEESGLDAGAHEYHRPSAVAADDGTATGVSVCPNPFTTATIVRIARHATGTTLTLYDGLGDVVRRIDADGNREIALAREGLSAGTYYLRVEHELDLPITVRMIVAGSQ